MKKYLYLIIQIDENGKKYAFARKLPADVNLLDLPHIPRAEIVRAAPTWKNARETATRWNAVHKANGVHLYDDPAF